MARGKSTSPEKVEEIKALSRAFDPKEVARRTGIALRTVYDLIRKGGPPMVEAQRERKAMEMREKVWDKATEDVQEEIDRLKGKEKILLDHITPEKAARARVTELTTGYGTLFDKRRMLENKSTANVSHRLTFTVITEDGNFMAGGPENEGPQEGSGDPEG